MRPKKLASLELTYMDKLSELGSGTLKTISEYLVSRATGTVRFTRRVMAAFSEHENVKFAAALSYFTLFSLFPLMLFLVYIASQFFPSEESRRMLANYLQEFFPYGSENLAKILEQTWQARGSIGIVSGVGLLWGGSSIFSILETSLSKIWDSNPRGFWRRRLLGTLSVMALVVTFLASFFIGPLTNIVLDQAGSGRQIAGYLMELTTLTMVMMMVYRIYPNEHVKWGAAFAGAFSAAVALIVAKFGFRLYTQIVVARSGLLYGSLTWFLTLALWVYLVGVLILFGAEFAAAFQKRQEILAANQEE
jgi:membrane protein